MNKFIRNLLIILAIFLVVAAGFSFFNTDKTNTTTVPLSRVVDEINSDRVSKIEVSDNDRDLTVHLKDGTVLASTKEKSASLSSTLKDNYGVDTEKIKTANIESKASESSSFWLTTVAPFVIPFLLIAGFIWFLMRQVQGSNNRAMSFGQSGAKLLEQSDRRKRVTFSDVA